MKWYENNAVDTSIIVSSRVRLARNLVDYPFSPILDKTGEGEIIERVKNALCNDDSYIFTDFSALAENERAAMVENHAVSPMLTEKKGLSAIVENKQDNLTVMVLEEDHIRIQSIKAGLCLEQAFDACIRAEEKIDRAEKIAYDPTLGYLTHCPTNLGTGLRASVMMFLPALTITGKIRQITGQLQTLGLCVRGVMGEGSSAKGSLYQFSNCTSLGMSEAEIIENLKNATAKIAETEKKLREELDKTNSDSLRDRTLRAYGTAKYAYLMTSEEMYRLYADIRLGICLGYIKDIPLHKLDTLLISSMPATLSVSAGKDLDASERDRLRASLANEL